MIELNLLPDVKMEYIKAQNLRRLMFTISAIVTVVSVVLLGFLISVNQLQKKHLKDLTADITQESSDLKGKKDISKILTVQNQLGSLTTLHDTKPAVSSLFTYLNQITPSDISLTALHADFTQYTFTITGEANSLGDVNKFVDTLKFTKYKADGSDKKAAFGNVVLSTFGLNSNTKPGGKAASFSVALNYDPIIFDITKKVELSVPTQTTTRAMVNNPSDLFQAGSPPAPATSTTTTTGGR